jgi:methylmalonyl-CoA/ethylmalonyl-CoA epimerase
VAVTSILVVAPRRPSPGTPRAPARMPGAMSPRIEHVAVAVGDLDGALERLAELWGVRPESRERVEDQGVEEAMVALGGSSLQLVSPTDQSSTVARFLERRGEGLHHIALEVSDLAATLADLKAKGVRLVDEEPRTGGRGRQVAFVHPRGNLGLLVELVQRPGTGPSAGASP